MLRAGDSDAPVFGPGDEAVRTLHRAVFEGDLSVVKGCIEEGVDPNSQLGHSVPLVLAVTRGFTPICRFLIDHGASVNFGGKSGKLPLYLAAKSGNREVVELLLEAQADFTLPFITGNTPLLAAASEGHTDIVRTLLDAGSNPLAVNNSGSTGLHMAAYQRNVTLLKMFLKAGVNVNMIQKRGKKVLLSTDGHRGVAPLHLAAMSPEEDETGRSFIPQCREVLNLLLDAGADVDAAMENGRTALHLAAGKNCTTTAEILIKHDCQIDPVSTENDEHKTPLHKAVDLGHVAMVRTLIDAGADLNSRDHWGVTPVFTAVFSNSVPITRLLIQAGCDLNTPTNNLSTPFIASLRHPPIITQMLLLGGCQGNITDFIQLSLKHDEERYAEIRDWILLFLENPKQLQQICREVTRQALLLAPTTQSTSPTHPREKIDSLPVPPKVKAYLNLSELDSMV